MRATNVDCSAQNHTGKLPSLSRRPPTWCYHGHPAGGFALEETGVRHDAWKGPCVVFQVDWCYTDAESVEVRRRNTHGMRTGRGQHAEEIDNGIITKSNQAVCRSCDGAGSYWHGAASAMDDFADYRSAGVSGVFLLHL